jgi:hypothetical protein
MFKEKHKKDKLYIKSLPAHALPKFNNVLYYGQAVVYTVSLISVYKAKRKKDKLYYKKPPGTCLAGSVADQKLLFRIRFRIWFRIRIRPEVSFGSKSWIRIKLIFTQPDLQT